MDGEKVGWTTYKAHLPCIGSAGLKFNFTTPPDAATMAACTDSDMMAAVCKAMGLVKGKNRASMAENLVKYMVGGSVKKSAVNNHGDGVRDGLVKSLLNLGITRGVKTTGKEAGKEMKLDKLNIEELKFTLEAHAQDDSESEESEVEDQEEEGAEEEVQDNVDEVGYFAHL